MTTPPIDTAALLAALHEDALLLEPREFFDTALVGYTDTPQDHWPRQGGVTVAIYDRERCVEAIQKWLSCDDEAALDYFGCNTESAWVGEGTPMFTGMEADDEDDPEIIVPVTPGVDEGYLAAVVPCTDCGERYCTQCQMHWADCPCAGPS